MRGWWIGGLLLAGCIFEYHPYEIRLEDDLKNLNAKSITNLLSTQPKDTLRIALIADTQRAYDELSQIVKSANSYTYDFMLVAGDLTEYGLQAEYDQIGDLLKQLKRPYMCAIGNHDFQGDGKHL